MKSERRHELEKNQLADWLADSINKVKPYQNLILGTAIVAAVVVAAYMWSARRTAKEASAGWDRFYQALTDETPDPANFDQICKQYPNTRLAEWSAAIAGDLYLSNGCGDLFKNKANAHEALRQASDRYRELLDESPQPMLKARATFGLARTYEAQGNLKKAIQRYGEVVDSWPHATHAALAKQRLEDLQRPAAGDWYDKFEEFDPQVAFADKPGIPGERLPFDSRALLEPALGEPLITPQLDLGPKKPAGEEPLKMPSLDPGADSDESSGKTPETPATKPEEKPLPPDAAGTPAPDDKKGAAAPKDASNAPAKDTPVENSEQ